MKPIPKIEISISLMELQQAIQGTECFSHHIPNVRLVKAGRSTLFRVIVKLTKKELTKREATKPFKLKLEFDEAHHLEEYLRLSNIVQPNHYHKTLADKLHQKLA
ncbi:hypothetical protein Peternella1_14 [Winogradskyella phage Peternella_1]|uniref:Uncharacterized protein n=1 Tax=Winogradskyella phage Peternella_1 TaxID=2745699 RepID=A0A8E4ZMX8_9CAUD|nr:hypothetical protein M1M32_gp14 [Winogradskyella phage Peternella_1]QQV91550.1 hypothetical protein Peternella1_14 [Winogradskyella phage Peternella_1]